MRLNNISQTIDRWLVRSSYEGRNERHSCVCGCTRRFIARRIWQISNKEDDAIYPKYYYRCPRCGTFSAVNIYFPIDKYKSYAQFLHIDDKKRDLCAKRCRWLIESSALENLTDPNIVDLGAGEGAFTHALADCFPQGTVSAVEADLEMEKNFYGTHANVRFVPEFIEDFLIRSAPEAADIITLTDVLEHVIWPERVLEGIYRILKPGGVLYMTTPNSRTFDADKPFPFPVAPGAVDWAHANRTCQHIFMMTPTVMRSLTETFFAIVRYSEEFETGIRRDSVYTTLIARKPR